MSKFWLPELMAWSDRKLRRRDGRTRPTGFPGKLIPLFFCIRFSFAFKINSMLFYAIFHMTTLCWKLRRKGGDGRTPPSSGLRSAAGQCCCCCCCESHVTAALTLMSQAVQYSLTLCNITVHPTRVYQSWCDILIL